MNNQTDNISTAFHWNEFDYQVAKAVLGRAETPEAIQYFSKHDLLLSNYGYWFMLSTLWVSNTDLTHLDLWKKLFASHRPNKQISLMKPNELTIFKTLPNKLTVYRAHRPNETDWIAYTLDKEVAFWFAKNRGTNQIDEYRIKKKDVLAVFLRREESEVIVLDKNIPKYQRTWVNRDF